MIVLASSVNIASGDRKLLTALVVAPPDGSYTGNFRENIRGSLSREFLVVESLEIPADLTGYEVVIVARYEAANPTTADYLRKYLESGGGVIVLFGTPFFFAGGTTDLSSLADWLGASLYTNSRGIGTLAVDKVVKTRLRMGDTVHSYECACAAIPVSSMQAGTQLVAQWDAGLALSYAYKPSSGKVYYSAGNEWEQVGAELLRAGVLWAANIGPANPFLTKAS